MEAVKSKTIPAGEFKQQCLALMDEVAASGGEFVITKHGRPVARLVPVSGDDNLANVPIFGSMAGTVTILEDDITTPVDVKWSANAE